MDWPEDQAEFIAVTLPLTLLSDRALLSAFPSARFYSSGGLLYPQRTSFRSPRRAEAWAGVELLATVLAWHAWLAWLHRNWAWWGMPSDLSSRELVAGGSQVQGHPGLLREYEASLEYIRTASGGGRGGEKRREREEDRR